MSVEKDKIVTKNLLKNKLCDTCLFIGRRSIDIGSTATYLTCENSQRYAKEKTWELPVIRTCERWKQSHETSPSIMYDYE
jgi:NMD protein affecting ribosome stability and mRNA decay